MKSSFLLATFICYFSILCSHDLDVVVKGIAVEKGLVNCSARYERVQEFLKQYERPFTLLDLGSKEGYYSIKVAEDFPDSCAIMVEKSDQVKACRGTLKDLCRKNRDLDNLIYLDTKLSLPELTRLSECEHIDVALIMAPSTYTQEETPFAFNAFIQTLNDLADYVFIELYQNSKVEEEIQKIPQAKYIEILDQPKTVLYLIKNRKVIKKRNHWYSREKSRHLLSSFETLRIYSSQPKGKVHQGFYPSAGINLITFKVLNGSWPSFEDLEEKIKWAPWDLYPYAKPFDLVIGGNKVYLYCDRPFWLNYENLSPKEISLSILRSNTKREIFDVLKKTSSKKESGKE